MVNQSQTRWVQVFIALLGMTLFGGGLLMFHNITDGRFVERSWQLANQFRKPDTFRSTMFTRLRRPCRFTSITKLAREWFFMICFAGSDQDR